MIVIDTIIRSKRKTLAIIVEADGKVTVRAPLRLSRARIDALVAQKADWVKERQQQVAETIQRRAPHSYRPGEVFDYLGVSYPLEIVDLTKPTLSLEDGRFRLARQAQTSAAQIFESWYRQAAHQYIEARVRVLAPKYGYTVRSLRITGAKTRWGSCGAKANLNFTWRLILAPQAVVEYVVIHELTHLEIRNHSRQFWDKVRERCPDYTEQRLWLKKNAWLLK